MVEAYQGLSAFGQLRCRRLKHRQLLRAQRDARLPGPGRQLETAKTGPQNDDSRIGHGTEL